MKRVAILQSSYIPWKGYFAIIGLVDEFILYDDVQYTKRNWRNRNIIKSNNGLSWLTIPVRIHGRSRQTIRQVEVVDPSWGNRHLQAFRTNYARARHFPTLAPSIMKLYERAAGEIHLSKINELFLRGICDLLEIKTCITHSSDYNLSGDRTERLISLCQQARSEEYLCGPAAKAYLEEQKFAANGVTVRWMDYSEFPEYTQLHTPPFVHEVTILDLLLNEGIEGARRYMRTALSRCEATIFRSGRPAQQP